MCLYFLQQEMSVTKMNNEFVGIKTSKLLLVEQIIVVVSSSLITRIALFRIMWDTI